MVSLMLADYPNPDGWQLEQGDVFASPRLNMQLARANVVLCNPPFEDFPFQDRDLYQHLRSVNRAVEILNRVLDSPPALLGFVLPHGFRDGRSFRNIRRRLVEQYGTIEITELPDRAFAHSDVQPILLLAHGLNQGQLELKCGTVQRADLSRFLNTGEPTTSSTVRVPTKEAAAMPSLWDFPLDAAWTFLRSYPTLETVAKPGRGIEYKVPLRANWSQLISSEPREGFALGIVNVEDDYEPFYALPRRYLNMSPELMRNPAYRRPWGKPKVIVNKARQSRGPWRLSAVADRHGLVVYQNFIGIRSSGDWPIEVIAAVLNGYVANAFIDSEKSATTACKLSKQYPSRA